MMHKPNMRRRDVLKLGAAAVVAFDAGKLKAQDSGTTAWQMRPLGPERPLSIDVHTHWTPEAYVKELARLGRPGTPVPIQADLDKRVQWMDQHGVQMLVLTLSGGMPWQWVSPAEGARLARMVNDSGMEAHSAFPERFLAAIEISVRDPKLAVEEINRVAGNPGLRAVHLPNSLEGQFDYVFDPAFAPVLARCEELQLPLIFHPLDGEVNYYGGPETRLGGPVSDSARYSNTLGFTFETATTATKFITTGALDKYPKLQVVLPHSGGSFPYVAGRVEHGLERLKFPLKQPFREYLRRFHYDTMTYDLETLRFLVELVGSDRVVVGTDNSFGARMNFEWPNAVVEHLKLPAADQDLILRGNAKRLFRLG